LTNISSASSQSPVAFHQSTDGYFYISSDEKKLLDITIYDAMGKIIDKKGKLNSHRFSYDASSYAAGIYLLHVTSGGG